MKPETSMAPAEWIARRTIWGSLGPVCAADEDAPVASSGAGVTSPRAAPGVGTSVTPHLNGDTVGRGAALVIVGGRDAALLQGVRWIWLIQMEPGPGPSARVAAPGPERQ